MTTVILIQNIAMPYTTFFSSLLLSATTAMRIGNTRIAREITVIIESRFTHSIQRIVRKDIMLLETVAIDIVVVSYG